MVVVVVQDLEVVVMKILGNGTNTNTDSTSTSNPMVKKTYKKKIIT